MVLKASNRSGATTAAIHGTDQSRHTGAKSVCQCLFMTTQWCKVSSAQIDTRFGSRIGHELEERFAAISLQRPLSKHFIDRDEDIASG